MRLLVAALIAITFLSSCAQDPVQVPTIVPIVLLPHPVLPKLTSEQEAEIASDTYDILVEREEILLQHIDTINGIIIIHNSSVIGSE